MNGTEFARVSGSYNTAFIGTYQVLEQNVNGNYTVFRLYGYFYYGGGTQVSSAMGNGFYLDGTYIHSGNYTFSPGYHLLGTKDIVIGHATDGTFPGRNVGISASSYHMSGSTNGNIYAGKINRLAVINTFTGNDINGNFNVTYTSYISTYTYKLRLSIPYVIALETYEYASNTTFTLSNETIEYLYTYTTNSNTVRLGAVIETWDGNTKLGESTELINVCVISNANPIFTNFTFEDTNSTTTALTGNNQKIIQGYSNVKATIPTEFIAEAQKGATMVKYSFTCSDDQKDIIYSASESTNNTINNVKSGVFNVYAIDSRNNSTLVTKNANQTISYTPITKGTATTTRQNGVLEQTTLSLNGTVDLVNFGQVTNSIQEAKFRYKITDSSTWSNYRNITLTVDNNGNYSYNGLIQGDTNNGFDTGHSYNIEIVVSDNLSTVTFTANLGSGIPNIALHKNGVGIMGKYDTSVGGLLQVAGKSIYVNYSTNEVDTGKKDNDGRKIYQKMYEFSNISPGNSKYTALGIDNLYRIVNWSGSVETNGSARSCFVSGIVPFVHYQLGNIYVSNTGSETINSISVIIEYKKTTN